VPLCLFRVLQEALANAVRHSRTPRVAVELVGTEDRIQLTITDFGVGFSPSLVTNVGVGLIMMRERVAMENGTLEITSGMNRGTHVTASIPLPVAPEAGGAPASVA
jgi:signal transduction histidine kinase